MVRSHLACTGADFSPGCPSQSMALPWTFHPEQLTEFTGRLAIIHLETKIYCL